MLHDLTSTEVCLVGVGIGVGYYNTNELHTMTYREEWSVMNVMNGRKLLTKRGIS